jgi:hypothetical protein
MNTHKYCPICNLDNDNQSSYCVHCGLSFSENVEFTTLLNQGQVKSQQCSHKKIHQRFSILGPIISSLLMSKLVFNQGVECFPENCCACICEDLGRQSAEWCDCDCCC